MIPLVQSCATLRATIMPLFVIVAQPDVAGVETVISVISFQVARFVSLF